MTWARAYSAGIAVACILIIVAHAPAVLTDPLQIAIAQIRVNAATTPPMSVVIDQEVGGQPQTSAKKSK